MKRLAGTFRWFYSALLAFSLCGCAELSSYRELGPEAELTSTRLRQNFNDYTVYYRPAAGILYKIKIDANTVALIYNHQVQEAP